MKIGPGVSQLYGVENRPLSLTWPMAYTTACTTVQAVIYTVYMMLKFSFMSQASDLAPLSSVYKQLKGQNVENTAW